MLKTGQVLLEEQEVQNSARDICIMVLSLQNTEILRGAAER